MIVSLLSCVVLVLVRDELYSSEGGKSQPGHVIIGGLGDSDTEEDLCLFICKDE